MNKLKSFFSAFRRLVNRIENEETTGAKVIYLAKGHTAIIVSTNEALQAIFNNMAANDTFFGTQNFFESFQKTIIIKN